MGFISDYKYEFNQCDKVLHTESWYTQTVYKEDKRYKDGKRVVQRGGYHSREKSKEDLNIGVIIDRNNSNYSLVESIAQCNYGLKAAWKESIKSTDQLKVKLIYLLTVHIIPFFPILLNVIILINHWKTQANASTKIAFTIYVIIITLIIVAFYAAIVMGIIYLVKMI